MSDAEQEDSKTKLDSLIGLTMSQFEKKKELTRKNVYVVFERETFQSFLHFYVSIPSQESCHEEMTQKATIE